MDVKYECNRECQTCVCHDNSDYLHRTMQKEEIYDRLRQNGCRITKQRQTLIDIIVERECSCCKEIYYIASKKMPEIGLATIYRMINLLEEVGAIRRENLYRICTGCEDTASQKCIVRLEGEREITLDQPTLHMIMEYGMEKCGYFKDKKKCKIENIYMQNP